MNYYLGLTSDNCNGRCGKEQLSDRIEVTAECKDGTVYHYYFKVPDLWARVIVDYLTLVQTAHPDATVTWQEIQ